MTAMPAPASTISRQTAAVVATCIAATAGILAAMGRTLVCTCGNVALWSGDIWSNENSQQAADPYSFTHLTHGIIFFLLLKLGAPRLPMAGRLVIATLIECGWEIVENTDTVINRYREVTISLDYYGDSVLNSTGDILFFAAGFLLAARLPWRWSVALMLVMEAVLAVWIRDGLLLNILMLLYPLDGIREWQAALPNR